jgi:hypothetical protein
MQSRLFEIMSKELILKINWPLTMLFVLFWTYGLHGAMASNSSIFEIGFSFYLLVIGLFFLLLGVRKKNNFTLRHSLLIKDVFILFLMILFWIFVTYDRLNNPLSGDQFFYSEYSKIHEFFILKVLSKFLELGDIVFKIAIHLIDLMILCLLISFIYLQRFFKLPFIIVSFVLCCSIIFSRFIIVKMGGGLNPHPSFQLFPLWLTSSLIGVSDFSFRLSQLFGLIISSFLIYIVFIKEFGRINAFFISTALCSIPILVNVATQVESSIWSSITFTVILIHLISMNNKPFIYWFSFGAIISIAILMRITSFIVIPIFIVLFLKHNWTALKFDKKNLFYVLSPFLLSMPFLLNSIFFGTPATGNSLEMGVIPKAISLFNQLWLAISSGIIIESSINIIGVGWLLMLIGIFLRHKNEKYYLFNRILVFIFLFSALFLFFSLRQTLWGFDKYRIEFLIPFMIFGGYLLFSKVQALTGIFFVIPLLSCFILFFGINGFKNYSANVNSSIDSYEPNGEVIYDYKSALVAAKEAGLAKNTLFVGVTYGMMPQILSGYNIEEVMASLQLCKEGIICGDPKSASSHLINQQTDIQLVLISDVLKYSRELNTHAALRNELLEMGWADWMEFSYQDNNVVYGVIRSKL